MLDTKENHLEGLLSLLELEHIETDLYRGQSQDLGYDRLFGGQVVAQALAAASRTAAPDLTVHSMHAYFLLAGDASEPIVYQVERIRNGRSFATRLVKALQKGRSIFCLSASFHKREAGFEHATPMPRVPGPEDLETEIQMAARLLGKCPPTPLRGLVRPKPIEFRMVNPVDPICPVPQPPERYLWFRAAGEMPQSPLTHQLVLAYATDFYLVGTSLYPHGRTYWSPDMLVASVDHTIWFHREARMDDWFLYAMESPNACAGRGLSMGRVYSRSGELVASVAQEGLLRQYHLTPDMLHP